MFYVGHEYPDDIIIDVTKEVQEKFSFKSESAYTHPIAIAAYYDPTLNKYHLSGFKWDGNVLTTPDSVKYEVNNSVTKLLISLLESGAIDPYPLSIPFKKVGAASTKVSDKNPHQEIVDISIPKFSEDDDTFSITIRKSDIDAYGSYKVYTGRYAFLSYAISSYYGVSAELTPYGLQIYGVRYYPADEETAQFIMEGLDNRHLDPTILNFTKDESCNKYKFFLDVNFITPRSQKAKGVIRLSQLNLDVPHFILVQSEEDIYLALRSNINGSIGLKFPLFARPCPVRPRHGFVESRVIYSVEDIIQVWNETLDADPDGEMLLMTPIYAAYNAVWVNGMLAVGPGNDGATSGHDSVSLPLQFTEIHDDLAESVGVHDDESMYIESVFERVNWHHYIVQARSGVPITGPCADYVPNDMEVKYVVKAVGDLLEWEEMVKNFLPGTAVDATGHSLVSHYGVHCRWNKVPILTTRIPVVGEILTKTPESADPVDFDEVMNGLAFGLDIEINKKEYSSQVAYSVLVGHNTPVIGGSDSFHTGIAAALMLRYAYAACIGEARHYNRTDINRSSVYYNSFHNFRESRDRMGLVTELFYFGKWTDPSSIGGPAWGDCAKSAIELDAAVGRFAKSPNEETYKGICEALNRTIDQAHNNGWWMNKFTNGDVFEWASKGHYEASLWAAPALHQLTMGYRRMGQHLGYQKEYIQSWNEIKYEDNTIVKDVVSAQFKLINDSIVHVQYYLEGEDKYSKLDIPLREIGYPNVSAEMMNNKYHTHESWSSSGNDGYYRLVVKDGSGLQFGDVVYQIPEEKRREMLKKDIIYPFDSSSYDDDDDDDDEDTCYYCDHAESDCICDYCSHCGYKLNECDCDICGSCKNIEPECTCEGE